MTLDPQRLTDLERSNLVAYLDGELPEDEAEYLRTKITKSVTARREIEALEKTWNLLDRLPPIQANEDLTSRTLTEVRLWESQGGRLEEAAAVVGSVALKIAALAATCAATFAVAYVATRWIWPDPSERLARNLPVAEHLDEYRAVGSFELLKMLDTSPVFNEDSP